MLPASSFATTAIITDAVPNGTSYVPEVASLALCGWNGPYAPAVTLAYSTSTVPAFSNYDQLAEDLTVARDPALRPAEEHDLRLGDDVVLALVEVVLVLDVADDLLQHVLDGDDAGHAALHQPRERDHDHRRHQDDPQRVPRLVQLAVRRAQVLAGRQLRRIAGVQLGVLLLFPSGNGIYPFHWAGYDLAGKITVPSRNDEQVVEVADGDGWRGHGDRW